MAIVRGRARSSRRTPGALLQANSLPGASLCSACGATPAPCTWRSWTKARATSPSSASNVRTEHFRPIGALHPPAIRLERAIASLYGLEPIGAADTRPWLDLGFWDVQHPLGARSQAPATPPVYAFLPTEGESLHQIPVGPVHAGIIEPGHFRFTASGETVVRLEQRLGYVHKGIESLMAGATIEQAARLAGRTSGDSTVAYALAFAHAVEAALDITVPPRALYLRALMAELERLANHFGDIGAICNDASFAIMHAHCGILRERILRAADACFGHRLMMDRIVPGGVASDLAADGAAQVEHAFAEIRRRFPRLVGLYDNTASLQERTVTTGFVRAELARQFGAGGYVGRASGRGFDARKTPGYAPYDQLSFEVPVLTAGDVNARVWVRIREVEQSLALIDQILQRLPDGPIAAQVSLRRRCDRRSRAGRRIPRRCPRIGAARRRSRRALPFARPVMVPVAAAGSRDRRQHRRRLSALQQIVQLLVFGPRSLGPR